jgi:thiol-disulfide isomerase/thioredoxin
MVKSIEIYLPVLCLLVALYFLATSKPTPGEPLDLRFVSVDGSTVDLQRLRGKVVLLDFWATWCPPCRSEVPDVVAVYDRYHSRGFEVIGISLDQNEDALRRFTQENGMVWPEFFDGNGWGNSLARRFSIRSIPQMWLLDQEGRMVTKDGRSDLDGQVAALLARPRLGESVTQGVTRLAR